MHKFIYLTFILVIIYGIYNSWHSRSHTKKSHSKDRCRVCIAKKISDKKEYIIDVINNGSNKFHLKGGAMEGRYIPKEDAKKVACYLLTLSNEECDYPKEAVMIFTSSCAGCHGVDGKGIKNTYPDLTKKEFLGMKSN